MYPVPAILFSVVDTGTWSLEQLRTWADRLIERLPSPPVWLLDLSVSRSVQEAMSTIRVGLIEGQIVLPNDLGDLIVGLLALRYQRNDLQWDHFVKAVGDALDAYGGSRFDVDLWHQVTSHGWEATPAARVATDDLARVAVEAEERLRQIDSVALDPFFWARR